MSARFYRMPRLNSWHGQAYLWRRRTVRRLRGDPLSPLVCVIIIATVSATLWYGFTEGLFALARAL